MAKILSKGKEQWWKRLFCSKVLMKPHLSHKKQWCSGRVVGCESKGTWIAPMHDDTVFRGNPVSPENPGIAGKFRYRRKIPVSPLYLMRRPENSGVEGGLTRCPRRKWIPVQGGIGPRLPVLTPENPQGFAYSVELEANVVVIYLQRWALDSFFLNR